MHQEQLYKITNNNEHHRKQIYTTGLNILNEKFDSDIDKKCSGGGLYSTTLNNINKFFSLGTWLRLVKLPHDNDQLKFIVTDGKIKSNMLLFEQKFSLFDPHTYTLINSNITDNHFILDYALFHSNLPFLQWVSDNKIPLTFFGRVVDWDKVNLPSYIKTDYDLVNTHSHVLLNCHPDVIKWMNTYIVDKRLQFS